MAVAVFVNTDDLSGYIDAREVGELAARGIDCRVGAARIYETVVGVVTVSVVPDDLSRSVDTCGSETGEVAAWGIDRRIGAAAIEEALRASAATVEVSPDDLSRGIDAICNGFNASWGIDCRVGTAAVEEASVVGRCCLGKARRSAARR